MLPFLKTHGATIARDGAGVAGAGCIVYGTSLIYAPAAWLIGGVMLLIVAVLAARSR